MMKPLVSCVMPTKNRADFIPAAIDSFLSQTYPNKELIILDDSQVAAGPSICSSWPIRVIFTKPKSTGAKRNEINGYAKGPIIAHWDDDDWSAPGRLDYQVKLLLDSDKMVTGFSNLLFWDTVEKRAKIYLSSVHGYVCGTSLVYLKEYWEANQFPDIQKGSDNAFIYDAVRKRATIPSDKSNFMVARIHGAHTSKKSSIRRTIQPEGIPTEFWKNEEMRINGYETDPLGKYQQTGMV